MRGLQEPARFLNRLEEREAAGQVDKSLLADLTAHVDSIARRFAHDDADRWVRELLRVAVLQIRAQLARCAARGAYVVDQLQRDHPVRSDDDVLVQLGVLVELDGELVTGRQDVRGGDGRRGARERR